MNLDSLYTSYFISAEFFEWMNKTRQTCAMHQTCILATFMTKTRQNIVVSHSRYVIMFGL